MTDSVQEHEGPKGPAQVLANIAQVLENNPEKGLDAVREAFEAERERAKQEIREKAKDFDSLKEVRLRLLRLAPRSWRLSVRPASWPRRPWICQPHPRAVPWVAATPSL